jgi:hypothetical protein
MTAESPGSSQRRTPPTVLARCLRLAAGVVALLLVSECIWLWQTWPVRELLQAPQPTLNPPAAR